jgi:hypothetical protein
MLSVRVPRPKERLTRIAGGSLDRRIRRGWAHEVRQPEAVLVPPVLPDRDVQRAIALVAADDMLHVCATIE